MDRAVHLLFSGFFPLSSPPLLLPPFPIPGCLSSVMSFFVLVHAPNFRGLLPWHVLDFLHWGFLAATRHNTFDEYTFDCPRLQLWESGRPMCHQCMACVCVHVAIQRALNTQRDTGNNVGWDRQLRILSVPCSGRGSVPSWANKLSRLQFCRFLAIHNEVATDSGHV